MLSLHVSKKIVSYIFQGMFRKTVFMKISGKS